MRDKQDRINTLWGELATVNERLAGGDAVTARKRIEYLRVRKQQWARIISAATQYDSAITLALIEQANQRVGLSQGCCRSMLCPSRMLPNATHAHVAAHVSGRHGGCLMCALHLFCGRHEPRWRSSRGGSVSQDRK